MATYRISLRHGEMLALADGGNAVEAVEQYYAEIDAYCPPSDDLSEEARVSALHVPDEQVEQLGELLAESDEDTPAEVDAVIAAHGTVRWTTLDVALAKGLWTVTERA